MVDDEEVPPSERSPLLHHQDEPSNAAQEAILTRTPRLTVLLLALIIFVMMFGFFLIMAPCIRIYEDIICHHYYDQIKGEGHVVLSADIDEKLCKGSEVQEELAIVMGGVQLVSNIPGLLFAFPYGVLADRIGRKRVFGLAMIGITLGEVWIIVVCWFWQTFPLRLIWLNPIFQIIGGGGTVIQTIILAAISDVSTNENLANHFFFVGSAVMPAELIAPSVAAALMLRSPWIPLLIGLGISIIGASGMIFLPETLHRKRSNGPIEPALVINSGSASASPTTYMLHKKRFRLPKLKSNLLETIHSLRTHVSMPLLLLLPTFLISQLPRQVIDLILRYISKRFSWKLAQTNFLLSLHALIHLLLLLAILPFLSHLLTSPPSSRHSIPGLRFNLSTQLKDLTLARISLILHTIGAALLAFAAFPSPIGEDPLDNALPITTAIAGLVFYTLGMGFSSLCRSLITTFIDERHVARLYAAISVVETIGAFCAAPVLAGLYTWGLRLAARGRGEGFLGLPFWGVFVVGILSGGGVLWFRVPTPRSGDAEGEEGDVLTADVRSSR